MSRAVDFYHWQEKHVISCLDMSYKCPALTLLLFLCCPFISENLPPTGKQSLESLVQVSKGSSPAQNKLFQLLSCFSSSLAVWISTNSPLCLTDFGRPWTHSWPPQRPSCVSCWVAGCWKCQDLWSSPGRSPRAWLLKHWSSLPMRDRAEDQV